MATENAPLSLDKTTAEKRTERPHWVLDDAVYSISALLLAVIIIHSIWTLIIRPRAEAVLSQRIVVTNVVACRRVSVAATTSTRRAPADRSSPDTSIAAEYHMLRHAIRVTTLRFRTASGCAFSSDRMGSDGARYHTW